MTRRCRIRFHEQGQPDTSSPVNNTVDVRRRGPSGVAFTAARQPASAIVDRLSLSFVARYWLAPPEGLARRSRAGSRASWVPFIACCFRHSAISAWTRPASVQGKRHQGDPSSRIFPRSRSISAVQQQLGRAAARDFRRGESIDPMSTGARPPMSTSTKHHQRDLPSRIALTSDPPDQSRIESRRHVLVRARRLRARTLRIRRTAAGFAIRKDMTVSRVVAPVANPAANFKSTGPVENRRQHEPPSALDRARKGRNRTSRARHASASPRIVSVAPVVITSSRTRKRRPTTRAGSATANAPNTSACRTPGPDRPSCRVSLMRRSKRRSRVGIHPAPGDATRSRLNTTRASSSA